MLSDCLVINALQVKSCIGCTAEERKWPQILVVNAKLYCSFEQSVKTKQLADTIDYISAINVIGHTCREGERGLLETLSDDIVTALFAQFSLLEKVELSIDKRVSELCHSVTVSTVRTRQR